MPIPGSVSRNCRVLKRVPLLFTRQASPASAQTTLVSDERRLSTRWRRFRWRAPPAQLIRPTAAPRQRRVARLQSPRPLHVRDVDACPEEIWPVTFRPVATSDRIRHRAGRRADRPRHALVERRMGSSSKRKQLPASTSAVAVAAPRRTATHASMTGAGPQKRETPPWRGPRLRCGRGPQSNFSRGRCPGGSSAGCCRRRPTCRSGCQRQARRRPTFAASA